MKSGGVSIEDALARLSTLPYEDIGFAKVDHHRALRKGFPEVILGQGKSPQQVAAIAERVVAESDRLLVTRADADLFAAVKGRVPDAVYKPVARAIVVDRRNEPPSLPGVMVMSGGTADIPVAEEAVVIAELMGNIIDRAYDVGISGAHRLFDQLPRLQKARVVVVVAGMEGALPSLVGGLVSVPVIAVPTSIGYGVSFGGVAPLLAMLSSCAAGVSVVNIDNGFGAGYIAALINRG